MKRLLDENDPKDEVLRLLIRAGANHHPPRSGKMRMVAALGLGSAVGLSASEVLAWLGTGSSKVALAVTVIGVAAGGTYLAKAPASPVAAPPALSAAPSAVASGAMASRTMAPAPIDPAQRVSAHVASATAHRAGSPAPVSDAVADSASVALVATEERPRPARPVGKAPRARAKPARAGAARDSAPARERALRPEPSATASSLLENSPARLTEETRFVDDLRVAAESHDRRAFERLQSEYARRFSDGQLYPEVERLRALLR